MRLLDTDKLAAQRKARSSTAGAVAQPGSEGLSFGSNGTIYFDGSCGLCTASVRRFQRIVTPRGFGFAPLQDPGVAERLGLSPGEIPDEIKLRTRGGHILSGADALIYVAGKIWWAWPVWAISFLPGATWVMRGVYRRLASNRHRISGACRL
jgi:predicted DCC family thiol-disulfide oxidoreductase YuxK